MPENTSISINIGTIGIVGYAFNNCTGLTTISIPNTVKTIGANAFNGTTWYNNKPNGMVYAGKVAYKYKGTMPNNTHISITEGTLGIAGRAFDSNSNLTSIDLPSSITYIGDEAFKDCNGLTSISIPYNVSHIGWYSFAGCSGLSSITIPSNIQSVGPLAFSDCNNITSVTMLSETPTYIERVFMNVNNANLYVPYGCKSVYESAPHWNVFQEIIESAIPSPNIVFADTNVKALCVANWDTNGDGELSEAEAAAVTDLGTVFKNNTTITSFDELAYFTGLTSIGEYAFSGCSNLTVVSIPSSMASIGQNAFMGCNGLSAVNITDLTAWCNISFGSAWANPVSLAAHLYVNGEELTELDFPDGLTSIGQYSFQGCIGLTSLTIPTTVKTIGASAFRGSGLTSVSVPDNVTTLGNCSFAGCPNLTSAYVGSGVSSYDGSCFIDNQSLQSLAVSPDNIVFDSRNNCNAVIRKSDNHLFTGCNTTIIPEDVVSIEIWAFRGSKGLEQITIPASVRSIGSQAFNDCPNLTTVNVMSENPPSVSDASSFSNRANATLYVPYGCRDAYLAANIWKSFKEIVAVIGFADANVKALCVANWDTNGDGELSETEAAAVTDLGTVFRNNTTITSFDELAYFTGLTSIGEYAFSGCSSLTVVSIPSSMASIGQNAFMGCNGLTAVNITDLTSWCHISFGSAWANPVSLAAHLYVNGEELTELDFPDGLTSIGQYSFQGCIGLTSLTIPTTVKTIGASAFRGSGLTSVSVPDNVTTLGNCSFAGCPNLTSAYVGSGVSSYDGSCFIDNQSLQSLAVSPDNIVFDSRNNCNAVIRKSDNHLFTGCNTTIIPEDVVSIEIWAFRGSKGLEQITIPASVRSIGSQAFNDCPNLTTVNVMSENPPSVSDASSFSNRANATLYVPAGCRDAYLAAVIWNQFGEIMEMAPSVSVGDLNGDGTVSITDVVMIIDVIAGTITDANQVAAADVNGDGTVSITDCVAAIDLIAAQQHNSPLMAMAPAMVTVSDYISGELQDGKLIVDLNNENRYTAFQMMVSVPEGMSIVKARMDEERGAEHQVFVRKIGDGQYLVAGFSFDNEELTGNSGRLLTITTNGQATGNIVISDVEFATADAHAWHLEGITVSGSTTGIADMDVNSEQTVYDLQGRKLDSQILRIDRTQGKKGQIVIVNGKKVVIKY